MRRAGGLWESLLAFENLHRAAYQGLRGKRGRAAAGDFFLDLESNLLRSYARSSMRAAIVRGPIGRRMRAAYAAGALGWEDVRVSLQAWNAHAAHGTTWRLRCDVSRGAVSRRPARLAARL